MKIYKSIKEFNKLSNLGVQKTYIGQPQDGMVLDEARMEFESPTSGYVLIKGSYEIGDTHFVIKISSEFGPNQRALTLVGDAETGEMIAMFPEGGDESKDITEIGWKAIQRHLETLGQEQVYQLQKEGFKAFSAGNVTIPNVIHMPFKTQGGDLHLKGAHKKGGEIFVLKIATGFPRNRDKGMHSSQGLMISFDARTGAPQVILKDEGHLTDLRTAISGRNAADELMGEDDLQGIGMLGTGVQARLQIEQLESLYPNFRKLNVWGHTGKNVKIYATEMTRRGWDVLVKNSPKAVAEKSNLLITTTPSEVALLDAGDITIANSLIIAIGADMPGKVEISPKLLKKAKNVLIDSLIQGKDHGNAAEALKSGVIQTSDLQEFGGFLTNGLNKPQHTKDLRIFLSSGIGAQDLQIVEAVIAGSKK